MLKCRGLTGSNLQTVSLFLLLSLQQQSFVLFLLWCPQSSSDITNHSSFLLFSKAEFDCWLRGWESGHYYVQNNYCSAPNFLGNFVLTEREVGETEPRPLVCNVSLINAPGTSRLSKTKTQRFSLCQIFFMIVVRASLWWARNVNKGGGGYRWQFTAPGPPQLNTC